MATLRKGICYRNVVRAYTRKSKYKKKSFVKAVPTNKIVRYHMGDVKKDFPKTVKLVAQEPFQVRHNALESIRVLVNRQLSKKFGNKGYHFFLNVYPHHVLRENKMLTGAGADRMQSGMQKAFGKVVGTAAQLKKGTTVFTIKIDEPGVSFAKDAMEKARPRINGKVRVVIS